MRTKKLFLFISISVLFAPLLAVARYTVFYIPVGLETLVPVTAASIERQAHFIMKDESEVLDQAFLLKKRKPESEFSVVPNLRAKIVRTEDSQVIFLDKPKALLNEDFKRLEDAQVAPKILTHLELKMKKACQNPKAKSVMKVHGCDLVSNGK